MKEIFKSQKFKTLLSYFLLAVAVIAAYKIILELEVILNWIRQFSGIVSPFFMGFALAYVLSIPSGAIQRFLGKSEILFLRKRKKFLSIMLTYVLALLLIVLILRLVVPSVYSSIRLFLSNFQMYYNSARDFIDTINELSIINLDISMDKLVASIRSFSMERLSASIGAIFGVSSALFSAFLAVVSSIYILSEKEKFKQYFTRLLRAFLPSTAYDIILKYTRDLDHNFKQYLYTQTLDGCILGTIATIELYLLGSQYALVLGIMLGIVNYIPYFGSIIGSLVAVVVVAFTQGIPAAVLTGVILLITQQIDGNIIQPKLMGGSFSLSPLLVIISISIGGALAGIFGMIAAIPIVAVLKNILEDAVLHFEAQKSQAKQPE
ncbi:AI-2E family transporter [Oscillospiraceae bacterium MB08-C2-2]|nr:AI-2E family transporter [Oscillospiraceae bacterium MB08-C2-2]